MVEKRKSPTDTVAVPVTGQILYRPVLVINRPDVIDEKTTPAISGRIRSPELVAELPATVCRNSGKKMMEPNIAKPTMNSSEVLIAKGTRSKEEVAQVPLAWSGGTDGILSPHATIFAHVPVDQAPKTDEPRLSVGFAMSEQILPEDIGRVAMVKKVADGFGRNFLLPQGLAVLATPGAMKQIEKIKSQAEVRRTEKNSELKGLSDQIAAVVLNFSVKAGETGKLYGSITSQEVAAAIQQKSGYPVKRQQLDMQPLRTLGEHTVRVRLTMDLIPELKVTVYREGEAEPGIATAEPVKEPEEMKPVQEVPGEEAASPEA